MTEAFGRLLLIAACLSFGCASHATVRGRVELEPTGPNSLTTLRSDSAGRLVIEGDLEPELRRLGGALVEVEGRLTNLPPAGGINVVRYAVLEIDGEIPFVGQLDSSGSRLRLDDGLELVLEGLPESISKRGTAKIWVIGQRQANIVTVRSAGVIGQE